MLPGKPVEPGGKPLELAVIPSELESKPLELPAELQQRLQSQGRKGNREELLNLVVEILKVRDLSVTDLAKVLDRSPNHVRTTYLYPLIQKQILRISSERV